jgi:hypothetical protein
MMRLKMTKPMKMTLRMLVCMMLCATLLVAQARDEREATVGMRAYVEQVVMEGPELVPAPSSTAAQVVVRVVKTWPHGEHLRYDLEWVGFEEGSYDLTKFLVRKDGTPADALPAILIKVQSLLPGDAFEPSDLDPAAAARLDGYATRQIVVGVMWGIGLLAILFVGRKWATKPEPLPPPPTLADRLRPMVEHVASGKADNAQKAELERLLVAFWRARLDLGSVRAVDAIMTIRKHEEAGALLRQVEAWLHAPEPPKSMDVAGLLRPYGSVTADSFAPIAASTAGSNGGGA